MEVNMKKIISIILIALLASLTFAGCGGGSGNGGSDDDSGDSSGGDSGSVVDDREISVISREDGSGTRGAFIELFGIQVKDEAGNNKDMTTKEAIIANKTDVMLTNVANDPYAIGYVSLGSLNNSVKGLKIGGTVPSAENIKNGSYTISRPFNIAVKGQPSGLAKEFIDFILSAEGQDVISNGYIAIDESAAPYSGTAPGGKIVIAGSSSVTPIMEKLAEAYQNLINSDADIQIQMSDSTTGMNSAIENICDIGMASRDLKDSELEQLTGITIAMDGIAVIVNNANPKDNLDVETVRAIFTGEITTWNL